MFKIGDEVIIFRQGQEQKGRVVEIGTLPSYLFGMSPTKKEEGLRSYCVQTSNGVVWPVMARDIRGGA